MKILLIDDEDYLREEMTKGLTRHKGHSVQSAKNGEEGWDLFYQNPDDFDLIISDVKMPGMTGLELLEKIRNSKHEIPVIIMSGHGDLETSIAALRLGVLDFVVKPFKLYDLYSTLDTLEATHESERFSWQSYSIVEEESSLILPSQTNILKGLIHQFQLRFEPICLVKDINLNQFLLCIQESVSNAIIHGNLEVSSKLKEEDWELFGKMIEEREQDHQYSQRRVKLTYNLNPEKLQIVVEDDGKGFDYKNLPDPNDPMSLLSSGRGIILIQHFMDKVVWNDTGNKVTMTKNIS